MKKIKPFLIQTAVGAIFICLGMFLKIEYYSTMIFSMGFGIIMSGIVQMIRFLYRHSPNHIDEYQEKKRQMHIDMIDERKQFIRMKSAYVSYQIMCVVLIGLSFVFALLKMEPIVIAIPFLLLIFQYLLGVIMYKRLEKTM